MEDEKDSHFREVVSDIQDREREGKQDRFDEEEPKEFPGEVVNLLTERD